MSSVLVAPSIWTSLNLLTGADTSDPRFIGTQAKAAYNQIFGTMEAGVPVENTGGVGTRNAHWRDLKFGTELMSGYLDLGKKNPLSLITVASLADLGYSVNIAAADPYTKPAGGSTFVAPSSSGSSISSSGARRAYSRVGSGQVSVPLGASLPLPTGISAQPARRPASSAAQSRFDETVVDAALTAAYQRRNLKESNEVAVRDESDVAEFSLVKADKFFAQLGTRFVSTNVKSMPARK
jgi:hypothetical protein